jgi:hypothetical protein
MNLVAARLAAWPTVFVSLRQVDVNVIQPKHCAAILNPSLNVFVIHCYERTMNSWCSREECRLAPPFHDALVSFLPTSKLKVFGVSKPSPAILAALRQSPQITVLRVTVASELSDVDVEEFLGGLVHIKKLFIQFDNEFPDWAVRLPVDTLTTLIINPCMMPHWRDPALLSSQVLRMFERIILQQGTVEVLRMQTLRITDPIFEKIALLLAEPASPLKRLEMRLESRDPVPHLLSALRNPRCHIKEFLTNDRFYLTKQNIKQAIDKRELRLTMAYIGRATDTRKRIPNELMRFWVSFLE